MILKTLRYDIEAITIFEDAALMPARMTYLRTLMKTSLKQQRRPLEVDQFQLAASTLRSEDF